MSLLTTIIAFLVAIGVLVTVHEFGHYWVARKLGVKVLRFSVGFGKPLWTRVSGADQTEYVLSALPLGGYVKMLDEREGEVLPEEAHRAFNRQTVWVRMAIVVAGPVFNFLFAIILYALTFMMGVDAMHPYVQAVKDSPAAAAGFQPGDLVTSVNTTAVASWEDLSMLLLEDYLKSPHLTVGVQTQQGDVTQRQLDLSQTALLKEEGADFLDKAGLRLWADGYTVSITQVLPDSPAARAGLQAQDKVLAVGGKPPADAQAFVGYIQQHLQQPVELQLERGGNSVTVSVLPVAKLVNGKSVGSIGAGIGQYLPPAAREKLFYTHRENPVDALVEGASKTWQMSAMTLKLMGRMLDGEVALKNISGPVTIAQIAGETASIGLTYFLGFLAVVSISLGVLNLLPVPMLDGGHLLYYIIELVKGSPVSERVEAVGFRIGTAIIACLMMLALYNDFMRLMN